MHEGERRQATRCQAEIREDRLARYRAWISREGSGAKRPFWRIDFFAGAMRPHSRNWQPFKRKGASWGRVTPEPLSNLDAKLRVAMRAEIKELHEQLGNP
jgi:hypothetical protein